jgi:photosystem II stability/assembly factor-like uncharacterized protein
MDQSRKCRACTFPFYGGYILNTTNGGNTWTIRKHDTTMMGFSGVYFTDTNTGTVVGHSGTILHTTDGGITWTRQTSGTTNDLKDVCFADTDTGTIIGGNWIDQYQGGTILRTTNGSKTWKIQKIPTQYALGDLFFTDAITGTVVGSHGTILYTTTGGEPIPKIRRDASIKTTR